VARTHARVQGAIWNDVEWRRLSTNAQWSYLMLLSQPEINNCGVLALVPRRWSGYAVDMTLKDLEAALLELENAGFVLYDDETQELVIRTFVKHDTIEKQPYLVIAAKRQFGEVRSRRIRELLLAQNPHLFGDLESLSEPLSEGGNARGATGEGAGVGDGAGVGVGEGARARRPLIGDGGYSAFAAAALSNGHATESEVETMLAGHRFVADGDDVEAQLDRWRNRVNERESV
jgi:hypothetical protein